MKLYSGNTESAKIINMLKKWVNNNVKMKHNYIKDVNMSYKLESLVEVLEGDFNTKEYLRFVAVLTSNDSSGNASDLTIIFNIYDKEIPENGKIELSYDKVNAINYEAESTIKTNANNLYFKFSNAKDNTGKLVYEYQIILDGYGYNASKWQVATEGEYIVAYTALLGDELTKVQIIYRVKDSVGNVSIEEATATFEFDKRNPVIELNDEENNVLENGIIINEEVKVRLIFEDDNGKVFVKGYKNNKLILDKAFNSDEYIEVEGFGHYKYVGVDQSGNVIEVEFIILESDNTYDVIDNSMLNDVNNAGEIEMSFDRVMLQELSESGDEFYFEDMSIIGDKDLIYFIGVVPDKDGKAFTIYKEGVSGSVFKQYTNSFPIRTSANVTNINPEYDLKDYLINYQGKKYVLIAIQDNKSTGGSQSNDNSTNQGGASNSKSGDGGSSFTWIFYVLGAAGAVGGGFLIVKLRKRVRAA